MSQYMSELRNVMCSMAPVVMVPPLSWLGLFPVVTSTLRPDREPNQSAFPPRNDLSQDNGCGPALG
ncbi:hypothetical protein GCM10007079_20320 [Nocardiopsis terrae]|nr:hypothetical protein GCM10007079_20320 [Nocardiopsis terrae]